MATTPIHTPLYSYSANTAPVLVSSGIQHFAYETAPQSVFGGKFSSCGAEIVDPVEWLSNLDKTNSNKPHFVIREPFETSNSGFMSNTVGAAIFGAGCLDALSQCGDLYVIHGDSPDEYLSALLNAGFRLLWDGHGTDLSTVIPFDQIRFSLDGNGSVSSATYLGDIQKVEGALASLDEEAHTALRESLAPLIRLLEYGKTQEWKPIDFVPNISTEHMSLGRIIAPAPHRVMSKEDHIVTQQALKFVPAETLGQIPSFTDTFSRFHAAIAFGRIWEGFIQNADGRGRAEHLHNLLSEELSKNGIEDEVSPEWLKIAVKRIGLALGVDFAFDAYLAGVELNHILNES